MSPVAATEQGRIATPIMLFGLIVMYWADYFYVSNEPKFKKKNSFIPILIKNNT